MANITGDVEKMDLDPKIKLKRFCYLGSYMAVFEHHPNYVKVSTYLHSMLRLCESMSQETFVHILIDVLSQSTLVRRDEPIFAYAAYLASKVDDKCKTAMRTAITEILITDDDIFLFAKYSRMIQKEQKRNGFSKTTRKAIKAWYSHQPPDALLKMWCRRRGSCGFTHVDLIRMCNVSEAVIGDPHLPLAFFRKCSELLRAAENVTGIKSLSRKSKRNEEIVKNDIGIESTEPCRTGEEPNQTKKANSGTSGNNVEIKDPLSLTVIAVSQLRNTHDVTEALTIIKEHKLTYDQVPAYFHRFYAIIGLLIPQMPYRQLLKHCRHLLRIRDLQNMKTWEIFKNALGNKEQLSASDIHPLEFLVSMNRIGVRWKATTSKTGLKKMQEIRVSYFNSLYRQTFGQNRATGLRMFVTMNLQNSYKEKFLPNYKNLKYIEAAVGLAFGYYKKEKLCDVFAYTEDRFQLHRLPWTIDMTVDSAMSCCEKYQNAKNGARLVTPLMSALKEAQYYDLFIVIVPTAGRNNPKQKSDFLRMFLDKYRQLKNTRAKLVIVNLRKYKKSMEYSLTQNENILEICGIDEHTVNLINNFALNRFG